MVFVQPENWQEELQKLLNEALDLANSQSELAREVGVNYQTIRAWRRGAIPNDANIKRLIAFKKSRENNYQKKERVKRENHTLIS